MRGRSGQLRFSSPYDGGMGRSLPGIRERMRAAAEGEWRIVDGWPDRRLRVGLRRLVELTARLRHGDVSVDAVIRQFRQVDGALADPAQYRSGSDFERRSLAAFDQLWNVIGDFAARPDGDVTQAEQDAVRAAVMRIPALAILGDEPLDVAFDLLCWNEANAVAEGVQRPFLAARLVRLEGDHRPADRFGLVLPLTELAIRFEDAPERRTEVDAEINDVLAAFRSRAPWPINGCEPL